jgi:hypothetical protein
MVVLMVKRENQFGREERLVGVFGERLASG